MADFIAKAWFWQATDGESQWFKSQIIGDNKNVFDISLSLLTKYNLVFSAIVMEWFFKTLATELS